MNDGDANMPQVPPPLPGKSADAHARPTCWKCGYDLTGLQVTDACPECGTAVWSAPVDVAEVRAGQIYAEGLTWGILSLVFCLTCIGPLAVGLAIPAVAKGRQARALVATGRYSAAAAKQARTGMTLGWVTIGISAAMVAFWILALIAK